MAKYSLPKGFKVSGIHCGVKRYNKDLAMLYSASSCNIAGVFTQSKIKAAPVLVTKDILAKGKPMHAVVINSGNANCCTGKHGVDDAKAMVSKTAKSLDLDYSNVCVSSTGLIGKRLPIDKILRAIPDTVKKLSDKGLMNFAKAILTTDKMRKIETVKFKVGNRLVVMTGVCKGAGMIHPNMATMLCYIMTDANIGTALLRKLLKKTVDKSFNRVSIDGDMSTNDTVLLMANGEAKNKVIKEGTKDFMKFQAALDKITMKISRDIVADGEGATKIVTVKVKGAKAEKDADLIARTIANSALVKTSLYGRDGNWGRVAGSVGASMVKGVNQNKLEIFLDGVCMFKNGACTHPSKGSISRIYKRKNVEIMVDLKSGKKSAMMLTCDLSKRYVEINAHYST